ncbi:MAG: hypothetical protein Q8O87_03910 [bacterium]|nr:hypothetical protein [bacterium]
MLITRSLAHALIVELERLTIRKNRLENKLAEERQINDGIWAQYGDELSSTATIEIEQQLIGEIERIKLEVCKLRHRLSNILRLTYLVYPHDHQTRMCLCA